MVSVIESWSVSTEERASEMRKKWLMKTDVLWAVHRCKSSSLFFFFQAEDGIRDYKVTGVQTCALPISQVRDCPGALFGNIGGQDFFEERRALAVDAQLGARNGLPNLGQRGYGQIQADRKSVV